MADVIELRGLRALGIHGWLPDERERAQPFELDLDVEADLAPPGRIDQLVATIDYGWVAETVARIVTDERFGLLEALAERVAAAVLEHDRVLSVTVSVRKVRPPVSVDLATAGVRITRRR